jgi:NADH-quinone oxidoreductase subunit H
MFTALFTLFAVYSERKISAFIQDRLGPMEVGKYGSLQAFADILKMLQK